MWNIVKHAGDILIAVACLVMITIGTLQLRDRFGPSDELQASSASQPVESIKDLTIKHIDQATKRGGNAAKIALIEFSDFQCPFCAQFARNTYPQIQREFIDTNQIAHVFFNYPLEQIHPFALRASEAAECAGQQHKFWDMRERLFQNQNKLEPSEFVGHASALGLEMTDFETCMGGSTVARIRTQMAEGNNTEVTGTPTLFVAALESPTEARVLYRIRGNLSYKVISKTLKDALASQLASARR